MTFATSIYGPRVPDLGRRHRSFKVRPSSQIDSLASPDAIDAWPTELATDEGETFYSPILVHRETNFADNESSGGAATPIIPAEFREYMTLRELRTVRRYSRHTSQITDAIKIIAKLNYADTVNRARVDSPQRTSIYKIHAYAGVSKWIAARIAATSTHDAYIDEMLEMLSQREPQYISDLSRKIQTAYSDEFENLDDDAKITAVGALKDALSLSASIRNCGNPSVFLSEEGNIGVQWRSVDRGLLIIFAGDGLATYSQKENGSHYSNNIVEFDPTSGVSDEVRNAIDATK